MKKKSNPILSVSFPKHPDDPPVTSYRILDLMLLKSIKSNFTFHKELADKILDDYIKDFEVYLNLQVGIGVEKELVIREKQAEVIVYFNTYTSSQFASYLAVQNRNTLLEEKIQKLEEQSDEAYYQQILTESTNSGKGYFPELIETDNVREAFIGLNLIWANKMFFDYLENRLLSESDSNSQNDSYKETRIVKIKAEIIPSLYFILLDYFIPNDSSEQETQKIGKALESVLNGRVSESKLLFLQNGSTLIYVFSELYNNQMIFANSKSDLCKWILAHFKFLKNKIPSDYKYKTVYKILTAQGRDTQTPRTRIDLASILK